MTAAADGFFMTVALDLARQGLGHTSPNPVVGCVVARDGCIVGRGFHPRAGQPHAELYALREAGPQARGADVYVSLEPCSHHGRTPPCVEALLAAGPRRVVVATEDPNPLVAGRGIRALREAGIRVEVGIRGGEARRLNEAFALAVTTRRSFVQLKLAATLDGKTATRSGDSRWITSVESRQRVHQLRDRCGAVLVGVGTVVADDPRLTVRLPGRRERPILRIVLDPRLRTPPTAALLAPDSVEHTVLVCAARVSESLQAVYRAQGCEVWPVSATDRGLDLNWVLAELYRRGRMEVLVEGGAETARSFLAAGLVDRVHLFYAPLLLGGRNAVGMLGGESPDRIAEALALEQVETERVGPDLYVTGKPVIRER